MATEFKTLTDLAMPSGELIPGFLIPVFNGGKKQIQSFSTDDLVRSLTDLRSYEPLLNVSALSCSTISCVVTVGETGICEGEKAVHAFYDGTRVFVGQRHNLIPHFKKIRKELDRALESFPIALAGLYDFIGNAKAARLLRSKGSKPVVTEFLARHKFLIKRGNYESSVGQQFENTKGAQAKNIDFEADLDQFTKLENSAYWQVLRRPVAEFSI